MNSRLSIGLSALLLGSVLATPTFAEGKLNVPPKGFKALFNGKDLTNWRGLIGGGNPKKIAAMTPDQREANQDAANKRIKKHWKVVDGILVFDGKGKSLCTAKDYGNFELYVDWKIKANGDSGIYLRGTPQVQIWDPKLRKIGSGGLFNNRKNASKPLVTADNPVGEWNRFYIKMVGDRVTVKLNSKLVVDKTPLENYWNRVNKTKDPLPKKGSIELQNHGNTLYFRNIFVRELGSDAR